MALMDIEDADGAIGEVGRALHPGGRFVASLSHPCFDQGPSSTWLTEPLFRTTKVWRKIAKYREPFADEIPWEIAPGQIVTTTGYHRPLSWYARALRGAGLLIRSLEEAWPTQEFVEASPQGPYVAEIPLHLIFEAIKSDQGSGNPRHSGRRPEVAGGALSECYSYLTITSAAAKRPSR